MYLFFPCLRDFPRKAVLFAKHLWIGKNNNMLAFCLLAFELRKNIVFRTKEGCSPLFTACKLGNLELVKYLLDSGDEDIEQKGLYETLEDHHVHSVSPIWVAAVSGHLNVVKLLIDYKADVNSLSDTGSTPLRSVCFLCKDDDSPTPMGLETNELNGINDNPPNGNANPDIFDISQGDYEGDNDSNQTNNVGQQREDVYFQIVKLLIENGADVSKANYNGGTCLINSLHNYQLTKFIIDCGADVNASDHRSKTALHYAIQRGRLEVTKLLLSRGANPMLRANDCDDALQLSCLGGHLEIFDHLIKTIKFPRKRLSEAYKLLGSSILEIHYDLSKVRQLWSMALQLEEEEKEKEEKDLQQEQQLRGCDIDNQLERQQPLQGYYNVQHFGCESRTPQATTTTTTTTTTTNIMCNNHNYTSATNSLSETKSPSTTANRLCDIRRSAAFSDNIEFVNELELQSLSADDFRIQSLLISERILGSGHRETIQRLTHRGTFYIHSLRPDRCFDLWIYALKLRLQHESIFHTESIFAAQAISKLFLDLIYQHQEVRFQDVYDVVSLLSSQLNDCAHHLSLRPVSRLHSDIFDLLLAIIVSLLFALRRASTSAKSAQLTRQLVGRLVKIDPRTSNGSSLLHVCISPAVLAGGDVLKELMIHTANEKESVVSPIVELVDTLIESGLDVDSTNNDGQSALQVLCSTQIRLSDKSSIVKRLIESGAHVDRRPSTPEQGEVIRQTLREAGVDPIQHLSLSCLAARKLAESKVRFDARMLTKSLRESIAIH